MRSMLATAFVLCSFCSPAQVFPPADYPRGYFRDPLNIPMSLAANFGELRPDHYHMGLDIRTQKKENLPVLAAAGGNVVKVVIEPLGFGQAIYIRHPNGYTTVYAHLNEFFPALAAYIHEQQYKTESWRMAVDIPPGLFPVKKGDLIAYSGNRGGSQGPHLHFEIRRSADDVNLNPLLFGLPVPDNTPPTIQRLAIYDRDRSIYEQSPVLLAVHRVGGAAAWALPSAQITVPSPRVSFAISAFDTQSGSANPNGIFQAILYEDDQPLIGFQMDKISYNDTRNINAHIDYKTRETGGPFLQHLSLLPGYPPPTIYASPAGRPSNGVIDLSNGQTHVIRIVIKDAYGNSSTLSFRVQYHPLAAPVKRQAKSGLLADTSDHYTAEKKFYPGMIDGLELRECAFYLGEKSLYDSVTLKVSLSGTRLSGYSRAHDRQMSDEYTIGSPQVPLLEPVLVRLQPSAAYDVDSVAGKGWISLTDKIVMVRANGSQREVQSVEWKDYWASARFREFGNFQLVEDNAAPVITPLEPLEGADLGKATRIAFSIKDNLGALRNFRAELDGKWLCFTNDKNLAFIYKFDEHCPPGRHLLKVSVEDVAGNRTTKEYNFTR